MHKIFFLLIFHSLNAHAEDVMQFKIAPQTKAEVLTRLAILNGRYEIYATGNIDDSASDRFEKFVKYHAIKSGVLIFDSPGGSLLGGIKLGNTIRSHQFDTSVGTLSEKGKREYKGICASSCAYAFAGGVYRYHYGEDEKLGIHQFYSQNSNNMGDIGETQALSSMIIQYLQSMGVDSKAFIIAGYTPGDQMTWLTPYQSETLGLSNNGADPTTVEIKMGGLTPYLKIEQYREDSGARIIIACDTGKLVIAAGIVTNPEITNHRMQVVTRSYLELNTGKTILDSEGNKGVSAKDSVLWLNRILNRSSIFEIMNANTIGIWTEDGGQLRWGAILNISPAKEKLGSFLKNVNNCIGNN